MIETRAIPRQATDNMAIYNRLKILIAEKELSERRKLPYRVIAGEIGVSTSTITAYVTQRVTRFDVPTLEAFCRYFNCQPGDLLWFVDVDQEEVARLTSNKELDNISPTWDKDHE